MTTAICQMTQRFATRLLRYGRRHGIVSLVLLLLVFRHLIRIRRRVADRAVAKKAWSNWNQEVAVVTGGSGGIGFHVVQRLAQRGVKVAILDIQNPPETLLSTDRIRFYQTDLRDYDSISKVAKQIETELGQVSILVNNAGVANAGPSLIHADPARTKTTIEVNLLSHFYTLHLFLPNMIRNNHGHVLSVASAASFIAPASAADYGATKAGVLSLHETLKLELDVLFNKSNGVLSR